MSEKMTRLRLPLQKHFTGLMEWGEVEPHVIVANVRRYADEMRRELAVIDEAKDEDFQIDIVRGPYVQHFVKEVQKSAKV